MAKQHPLAAELKRSILLCRNDAGDSDYVVLGFPRREGKTLHDLIKLMGE